MFICNTICDPEFANHFILVDQMSHSISKSPMKFRPNGPIDTCSPNPRNNFALMLEVQSVATALCNVCLVTLRM